MAHIGANTDRTLVAVSDNYGYRVTAERVWGRGGASVWYLYIFKQDRANRTLIPQRAKCWNGNHRWQVRRKADIIAELEKFGVFSEAIHELKTL